MQKMQLLQVKRKVKAPLKVLPRNTNQVCVDSFLCYGFKAEVFFIFHLEGKNAISSSEKKGNSSSETTSEKPGLGTIIYLKHFPHSDTL